MAVDVSTTGALRRRLDLQARLWEAAHGVVRGSEKHASCKELHRAIQSYLIKASDARLIRESPAEVRKLLLYWGPNRDGIHEIAVGTVRNFNRSRALPHFTRSTDDAWFDFQLLVREHNGQATVLAYDFELRLPPDTPFAFVRFDMNPVAQGQADDGLRSHLHINADDDGLVCPAPVMSPFEILDLFLHGVRRFGRIRRSPV